MIVLNNGIPCIKEECRHCNGGGGHNNRRMGFQPCRGCKEEGFRYTPLKSNIERAKELLGVDKPRCSNIHIQNDTVLGCPYCKKYCNVQAELERIETEETQNK